MIRTMATMLMMMRTIILKLAVKVMNTNLMVKMAMVTALNCESHGRDGCDGDELFEDHDVDDDL